ncbi:MAG: aminotransferase class IV [Deltaproteobacteria bacterium]|nr:aminotransferase class IV [Deltaproteobacteria bacterium]MBI4795682.1 aminotransferase class IV [Deltaproteobacteria bacterium]
MKKTEFVWLNDALVPLDQAVVSVNDRGFLYGDGFFETLRAEEGHTRFLKEHLSRLRASAQAFRIPFPENFSWEERLGRVLAANGLNRGLARVKILVSRGPAAGLGLPGEARPTLVIWAQPYTPPGLEEYARGWPLATFPERRTTFLGRHKSLNYLFYLAARQYALDQGAKEALILEADGLVSEGAATSLVYAMDGGFFTPQAPSALPGVTIGVLRRGLPRRGLALKYLPTTPSQLSQAEGLWLTNSLMGVMPVSSLDGRSLPISPTTGMLQECLDLEAQT